MVHTVLSLLGLGLVMAFSPTTLGIEVRAVRHTQEVLRRVLVVVVGVALSASTLAALAAVVGPALLTSLRDNGAFRSVLTLRWVDAAAGMLLVVAGAWRWVCSSRSRPERRSRLDLDRPRLLLLVVFGESLVSTTGPATMYLVVRSIAPLPRELWPLAYVVFLLGLSVPYLVLGLAGSRLPTARGHHLTRAHHQHCWQRLTALVLLLAGTSLFTWTMVGVARA